MIQSAQVASKFTLFTHHAKTFPDLVTALRNSMLRAGVFKDERTAEEQVVQVLNFDIHLVKDFRGVRYIERITECIPVEEKNEYTFDHRNEKTLEGKMDKFMDNAAIFFGKTTNRELYKYRNIMEYVNDTYVLTNPISDKNISEMRINMEDTDMVNFDQFLERNWGIKAPKMQIAGSEAAKEMNDVRQETVPVSSIPEDAGAVQKRPTQRTVMTKDGQPVKRRTAGQVPPMKTRPVDGTTQRPVNRTKNLQQRPIQKNRTDTKDEM